MNFENGLWIAAVIGLFAVLGLAVGLIERNARWRQQTLRPGTGRKNTEPAGNLLFKPFKSIHRIFYLFHRSCIKKPFGRAVLSIKGQSKADLPELVHDAGYDYDKHQDIFYSHRNAWQREMGYCKLYDEACAPLGMIVDCEPIPFEYEGRKWMIELWKGQYDLTTGCEIGVYVEEESREGAEKWYPGTFYRSVDDKEMLAMSFWLMKNGNTLFTRKERHWWLTGFKLGMFSQPWELSMRIRIKLKNAEMCNAFLEGLSSVGYSSKEIFQNNNEVDFHYTTPHNRQPITRNGELEKITQIKNRELCKEYQRLMEPYGNIWEGMNAVRRDAPWLFMKVLDLRKGKKTQHKAKRMH